MLGTKYLKNSLQPGLFLRIMMFVMVVFAFSELNYKFSTS